MCGLTTALRLKRQIPSVDLQVVGEKIASRTAASDPTTSEGAAGLWKPFALSGTPDELVNRWGKETLDHYMEIYLSDRAPEAGNPAVVGVRALRRAFGRAAGVG